MSETTTEPVDLTMDAWGVIANAIHCLGPDGLDGLTIDQLAALGDTDLPGSPYSWAFAALRWRDAFHEELDRRAASNLVQHAVRELELLGQTAEDPAFARSLVEAVAAFSAFGHSGGSAEIGRDMLMALLSFQNLAPLTTASDEWIDRSVESGVPMWQSTRNSTVFCDGPPWAATSKPYKIAGDGRREPYLGDFVRVEA